MQVIKKTKEVSVIKTEPHQFIIRVPGLHIPVHYLQLGAIFVCLLALFGLLTSVKNPEVKSVEEIVESVEPQSSLPVLATIQPVENKESIFPVLVSKKTIRITTIIKDKDILEFLTHNEVLKRAYNASKKTGLKTGLILTQKCLESGKGNSKFCEKTKNLGNIKCFNKQCKKSNRVGLKKGQWGTTTSHCIQYYDDYPSDRFLRFPTYQAGWDWYAQLIKERYDKATNATTAEGQAKGLKADGYATDKFYAEKLIKYYKQWNFHLLQFYIDEGYTITSDDGSLIFLER